MIQRIQSIYLFLALILSIALFFLPVSTKIIPAPPTGGIAQDISMKMDLMEIDKYENGKQISSSTDHVLPVLNAFLILMLLYIIFSYKKRKLQIKLSRISLIVAGAFIAYVFFISDSLGKEYGSEYKTMYLAGSYFPIIEVILLVLAIRAIKKDEAMVQSADRIR
jgi:hypothetical protein